MNNRFKSTFTIGFIVVIALVAGTLFGIFYQRNFVGEQVYSQIKNNKLLYTIDLLRQKYVDQINDDSLAEIIIPQLLSSLDPHSVYIPLDEMKSMNEPLAGKFDGIGVMFNMFTDTVLITNVISGGPSSKSGILPGDKIMTVNDSLISGRKMDSDKVVKMLRGDRGTKVNLGIQRGKNEKLISITVTRGEIPVKSVTAAFIIEKGVGFVRVDRFAANTYKEFSTALAKLQKAGMKKLIIDLRGNGGGFLDQAIYMANEFLPKGVGIVYTQGLTHKRNDQFADGRGRFQDIPLVVLMSPESASASEVFAGALQDNDRAIIVGLRSYGKGLIQEQFGYPDGSAARITVAHYYTPLGRSIQKQYERGGKDNYQMELYDRMKHNEYFDQDSVKKDQTQKFVTKGGRILYGGGGIIPDIFVPLDTTKADGYFSKLIEDNLIFKYATMYTEKNRAAINAVTTVSQLDELFAKSNLYMDFVSWADRQGVKPTDKELTSNKVYILAQLRAYIGRNSQLEDDALYYYIRPIDNTLNKGVEAFLVN